MLAAVAVVAATGTVALVGVAGAADQGNADVYSKEAPTNPSDNCFSTDAAAEACQPGEVADVAISTGDTVTWHFDGNELPHNAASSNDVPADPAWESYAGPYVSSGSYSRRFTQPGVYEFVCQVHPATMKGTITVTGDPAGTPDPTPTPTPTATATATPQPTATPTPNPDDDHTRTPAPSGGNDEVRPTIAALRTRARRRAVRVRFELSEPATVTIKVKRRGNRRARARARVQAPAGRSAVKLRSKRLKRGRYVVLLRARDATGNRSTLSRKSVRLRRR